TRALAFLQLLMNFTLRSSAAALASAASWRLKLARGSICEPSENVAKRLEIENLIKQICGTNLEPGAKEKIERLLRTVLILVDLLQQKNKVHPWLTKLRLL
ncbi:MAG: hypothetical protein J2P21_02890, partial [Chloracidobacterium sp.]|nr:hypothetical protein [Chloracidobacterium sp.]